MTQVIQVPSIGVWLEMLREASICLQSVRHVVLADDRVGVARVFCVNIAFNSFTVTGSMPRAAKSDSETGATLCSVRSMAF